MGLYAWESGKGWCRRWVRPIGVDRIAMAGRVQANWQSGREETATRSAGNLVRKQLGSFCSGSLGSLGCLGAQDLGALDLEPGLDLGSWIALWVSGLQV